MGIETRLMELSETSQGVSLRQFACRCCKRLLPMFGESPLKDLISAGESRVAGSMTEMQIEALGRNWDELFRKLYPGFGDPSPLVAAMCAAAEVVFTASDLTAAINASGFVADAMAKLAACEARDDEYDATYESAYTLERESQSDLLTQLVRESSTG